jgi:hypothetical protein
MIFAAEYIPSPLRLMLGRHSGIGNRIPRESPIPDLAGKQGVPDFRFGREPGIGVPIRRAIAVLAQGTRNYRQWASQGHSA